MWSRSITASQPPILCLPGWGFWYVIDARVAENDIHAWQAQGKNQELLRSAMRALLKERFRLVLHEQQTKIPVYNLVVSRKGIRFKPSAPGAVLPVGYKFPDGAGRIETISNWKSFAVLLLCLFGAFGFWPFCASAGKQACAAKTTIDNAKRKRWRMLWLRECFTPAPPFLLGTTDPVEISD
jgi:hypothetical protein